MMSVRSAVLVLVFAVALCVAQDYVREGVVLVSNAAVNDGFGNSVALHGDYGIAGAAAADLSGASSGAAYLLERVGGGAGNWTQKRILSAASVQANSNLGSKVAIYGQYAVATAPKDSNITENAGMAVVYYQSLGGTNNWGELQVLRPSDPVANGDFGISVDMYATTIIIGAPGETTAMELGAGAAYVYDLNGGSFTQKKRIQSPNVAANVRFGAGVAISQTYAVVGESGADFNGTDVGVVYVFGRNTSGASQYGYIHTVFPPSPSNGLFFGGVLDLSDASLIVGVPLDSSTAERSGTVHIYAQTAGKYVFRTTINPPFTSNEANFGASVSLSGDNVVVGMPKLNLNESKCGGAFLYSRNSGGDNQWGLVSFGVSSAPSSDQRFGTSVALSGLQLLVGIPRDDRASLDAGAVAGFGIPSSATGSAASLGSLLSYVL